MSSRDALSFFAIRFAVRGPRVPEFDGDFETSMEVTVSHMIRSCQMASYCYESLFPTEISGIILKHPIETWATSCDFKR